MKKIENRREERLYFINLTGIIPKTMTERLIL